MAEPLNNIREALLTRQEVERITGLGRSALAERRNPKSKQYDPTFPSPVTIGGANSVRYVASEVEAWVRAKIEAGRKGA
ncbi:MAG: helix-turn-helix transcriptional regulator [Pseudomonadota bacterium]